MSSLIPHLSQCSWKTICSPLRLWLSLCAKDQVLIFMWVYFSLYILHDNDPLNCSNVKKGLAQICLSISGKFQSISLYSGLTGYYQENLKPDTIQHWSWFSNSQSSDPLSFCQLTTQQGWSFEEKLVLKFTGWLWHRFRLKPQIGNMLSALSIAKQLIITTVHSTWVVLKHSAS